MPCRVCLPRSTLHSTVAWMPSSSVPASDWRRPLMASEFPASNLSRDLSGAGNANMPSMLIIIQAVRSWLHLLAFVIQRSKWRAEITQILSAAKECRKGARIRGRHEEYGAYPRDDATQQPDLRLLEMSVAQTGRACPHPTARPSPINCRILILVIVIDNNIDIAVGNTPSLRSVSTESPSPAADPTYDWANQPKTLRSSSEVANIREYLRDWEAANPTPALASPRDDPADDVVTNVLTRNRTGFGVKLDVATQNEEAARPHFDGVDMVDLGLSGAVLETGDLVEVSSGSWGLRLLAICLGSFNGHLHFYTNTGKWFTSRSIVSNFVVKKFVEDPAELHAVIDAIPSLSPSSSLLNELQDLNIGPSRDLAASLIRKMYTFQSASRLIHQTYVERLSRAHTQLGREERMLSLREIADALLPASLKRNKGAFPPEALHAVYSVIEEADIAFHALHRGTRHHESYAFALRSAEVQENVVQVEELVRAYYESLRGNFKVGRKSAVATTLFTDFLEHARSLIDQVRTEREWSPHGMIGPSKKGDAQYTIPAWSDTGRSVIRFMEHWAASGGFRPSSRCHWIGASILRALNRYDDALLDPSTGWTFLQEIGWIPPWDISARHTLRLPEQQVNRHASLPSVSPPDASASELGPDRLADLRHDFARSTVYCIDLADTLDVDDGVSLESLGNGEHWIHVHVADPASRIPPGSVLAEQAALRAQTTYLAGFHQSMLDGDHVREAFSLGPNQPTLTFSARVTETGRILESKVTPGVLRDVLYVTPQDVSSVVGDDDPSTVPTDVFELGDPPARDTPPVRRMTTPSGLSRSQIKELRTLWKLADALQRVRFDNGAVPAFLPRPAATVSTDGIEPGTVGDGVAFYRGDPFIRIAYDGRGSQLVSSLMQLAGQIGAQWCYERDIPIPYRVQLLAGQNRDAILAFTRDVFYPQLTAGKTPPAEDWHTLRALVGGFDVSTSPAPNLAMGLDLYTKVTSPLRRYPDMLVHWQIEAALLEEHRRGSSVAVRTLTAEGAAPTPPAKSAATEKDAKSYLPFSKRELEDTVLPRLRIRERHGRLIDNVDGNSQWILQALVRAWRFGEASSPSQLPKTFRYTVSDVLARRAIKGRLDWFEQPATVELEDLNDVVRIAQVKPGDVFNVELANVNVYMNRIHVRLLEKVEEEE
ncbi:RNB-domain-containing protein [Parathielavia hyrcaniae]|uniref:RNB-domain-containing protein n=1 Tax=Parathielavia hyrcaniae TaxID=113614 RepID=A0AAN6Q1F7_9PEZI|nr:RNB-domain-containing protein [Parathielavia hyrcaniae]